nr:MAG TPA: hypothetical protein [Caudoviricetes sp.]
MSFGVVAPYKNSYDISEVMNEERRSDCYGIKRGKRGQDHGRLRKFRTESQSKG